MGLTVVLHDKQDAIWKERRNPKYRNFLFCGGIQCGKTTLGSCLITDLAATLKDPEDTLIIAAPTYKILQQATLPKFLSANRAFGTFNKQESTFRYHSGVTVYMRTATNPESMEGIPNCRGVWLDEGGNVPRYFWENCMGRAARLQAPTFITSTAYAMNWLAQIAEETLSGKRDDTLLVQLRSVESPYFPQEEFDRQRKLLDPRRFAMKYMGLFGKMQGLVFPDVPFIKSHSLPPETKFYAGVDWGHTDPFALVVRAITPEGVHFRVDEYFKTGLIASEIMRAVKAKHELYRFQGVWCDPSRPEYIDELTREGIPAMPGNNAIRLGIDKHTELIRTQRFFVWEDMNPHGKDEYETYHYPEPKERTFDQSQKDELPVDAHNHSIDADRYCTMGIGVGEYKTITPILPSQRNELSKDHRVRIEQLKRRRDNRQL